MHSKNDYLWTESGTGTEWNGLAVCAFNNIIALNIVERESHAGGRQKPKKKTNNNKPQLTRKN